MSYLMISLATALGAVIGTGLPMLLLLRRFNRKVEPMMARMTADVNFCRAERRPIDTSEVATPPMPWPGALAVVPTKDLVKITSLAVELLPPRGEQAPLAWLKAIRGSPLDVLVTESEATVGRSDGCTVIVDQESVSRRQFVLHFRSGNWYVEPLHTSNVTAVSGRPLELGQAQQLVSGDVIEIGSEVALRFTVPRSDSPALSLTVGSGTAKGGRAHNEDSFVAVPTVLAVADGVGGRPHAATASRIACDLVRTMSDTLPLVRIVPLIDAAIAARIESEPGARGMATTLDAVRFETNDSVSRLVGVHVGDGCVLQDDGVRIRFLTAPHTVGVDLAAGGNPAAPIHPDRTRLSRAFGLGANTTVDEWEQRARGGHRYVLTSDGLMTALGTDRALKLLASCRGSSASATANRLVNEAIKVAPAGGADNVTVVVGDVVPLGDRA